MKIEKYPIGIFFSLINSTIIYAILVLLAYIAGTSIGSGYPEFFMITILSILSCWGILVYTCFAIIIIVGIKTDSIKLRVFLLLLFFTLAMFDGWRVGQLLSSK
jgi:hypothetical protein